MDMNEAFNSVCRILFREELGSPDEFAPLLKRYTEPVKQANSILSGKEVYYSEPYCKGAKFISLDEVGQLKPEPLSPNEIKDIDSLLNAVQERFHYSGNKILGHSQDVQEGENCVDSFHVYRSREIFGSEYTAYCQMVLDSKFMFGCSWGAEANFCMNTTEMYRLNRCFEVGLAANTSDAYFSYNCKNCSEIMFSFNQYSKRHCIGNNALPKDKYLALKEKLLSEVAELLKKGKTCPSLVEMAAGVVE